jgi:hypothetical protein
MRYLTQEAAFNTELADSKATRDSARQKSPVNVFAQSLRDSSKF